MSAPETKETYIFYHYDPSLPAAVIFAALFFASSLWHTIQIFRTRSWFFIPLLIGGLFEAVGYVGRILSHYDTKALGPYIMQTLLLLVAPALFAASIYMILGRLISLLEAEKYSVIRIRWLTKLFVFGDVLSFLMQSTGGGMMAQGNADSTKTGENIVLGGLFVQILFFGFFIIVSLLFHKRIHAKPTYASQSLKAVSTSYRTDWQALLYALYGSSVAILVRSVFRVLEYVQGHNGYLLRNEIWLYLFDAILMLASMVIFNLVHPSGVIPNSKTRKANSPRHANIEMEPGLERLRTRER